MVKMQLSPGLIHRFQPVNGNLSSSSVNALFICTITTALVNAATEAWLPPPICAMIDGDRSMATSTDMRYDRWRQKHGYLHRYAL